MTFSGGETVTILTAGIAHDPYSGIDEPSWDVSPTETLVENVLVGSAGSSEPIEVARDAVDSDFDLIFQSSSMPIPSAQDRVVVRGLTCDVVGRPFVWTWPTSASAAGTVVRVKVREG